MSQLKGLFYVLLSCLCLSCAKKALPPPQPFDLQLPIPAVSTIKITGNMHVRLHTSNAKPRLILRGDRKDLIYLKRIMSKNSLDLSIDKMHPRFGSISIDITTKRIRSFSYKGSGLVEGHDLQASPLALAIDNSGKTSLSGNIVLSKVSIDGGGYTHLKVAGSNQLKLTLLGTSTLDLTGGALNLGCLDLRGPSRLNMRWIKAPHLKIFARNRAFLQLSGVTQNLEIELWDQAHFKGRYLRTKRVWVKTHQRSIAEISAERRQSSLALDASDIYYFILPDIQTNFMRHQGAVLDLRDHSENPFKEPVFPYKQP